MPKIHCFLPLKCVFLAVYRSELKLFGLILSDRHSRIQIINQLIEKITANKNNRHLQPYSHPPVKSYEPTHTRPPKTYTYTSKPTSILQLKKKPSHQHTLQARSLPHTYTWCRDKLMNTICRAGLHNQLQLSDLIKHTAATMMIII